ncbi:unnamed protein product [Rhizoctonia solani]|uniref:Uncharacterized protein n=1 Tax=Rhizoctonia solani TaxID=456999 RepID=A0A8H3BD44_9AGAM|nr:unnamed protein product [Rhizoctonia solani]
MAHVAIVTGAAQGIGRAIALRLASDGIDVAVNDIDTKQTELEKVADEIKSLGRNAITIPEDVSKEVEVQGMVAKTVEELGSLGIMVANAGVHTAASILDIKDELFDLIIRVNCKAGSLNVAYSTFKFSVRAITQTAAVEWGEHNITVNAYAPGLIDTPIVTAAGGGASEEQLVQSILPVACMKRIGRAEEVVALVGFLVSEGASYVTGQTLSANSGVILS